ncbi:MAG: hypothetical protein M5R36_05295 [Deltaproteobacteria bacterium]|nr:hypothetical protein [Deltaproteobacteria bacterium]
MRNDTGAECPAEERWSNFFVTFTSLGAVLGAAHFLPGRRFAYAGGNAADPTYWAMLGSVCLIVASVAAETAARGTMPDATPEIWLGRFILIMSIPWTWWSRRVLGANYAPTASNDSPGQKIVREGPYRWFRHPIYLGNAGSMAGLVIATGSRWSWSAFAVFAGVLAWRIRIEDASLRKKFPEIRP